MSVLELVRADLRDFGGYGSARKTGLQGRVWLNANESPWPAPSDLGMGLNRYPSPQPPTLRALLARRYAVDDAELLVTRGSDEGIDLLVRAMCRAEREAVLISTPTFGMYAVCARVQGAAVIDVPLQDLGDRFSLDVDAVLRALESSAAAQPVKLVFVCSPGNPTGAAVSLDEVERLLLGIAGRAVVVVDEAYAEYSAAGSALSLRSRFPNLVVLRTLSKAYALAGARVGITIADSALIKVLAAIAPPYPLAAPAVAVAEAALSAENAEEAMRRARLVMAERNRLLPMLRQVPGVRAVYASDGNFMLVRFNDADAALAALLAAGIVVRDQRAQPALGDALRISIGTVEENNAVLAALQCQEVAA